MKDDNKPWQQQKDKDQQKQNPNNKTNQMPNDRQGKVDPNKLRQDQTKSQRQKIKLNPYSELGFSFNPPLTT